MSDIVGEGMSLNKRQKDIPPDDNDWQIPAGLVEESCNCCDHDDCDVYATSYNEGYDGGVQDSMLRATQIERVLQDLIAELRDGYESDPYLGGWHLRAVAMLSAADRAEARLRELDAGV